MTEYGPTGFADRLHRILGDRRQYAWGERVGASRGSVNRMFKGEIPGWELLLAIHEVERVDLNWLLTGHGAPYVRLTEVDGARLLATPGWDGHWFAAADALCLCLIRPARRHTHDRPVNYSKIHVLPVSTAMLERLGQPRPHQAITLTEEDFRRLCEGWMGNLELLTHLEAHAGRQPLAVAEPALPGRDSLCHNLRRLPEGAQRVVRATVRQLLEEEGKAWEEFY